MCKCIFCGEHVNNPPPAGGQKIIKCAPGNSVNSRQDVCRLSTAHRVDKRRAKFTYPVSQMIMS